MTWNVEVSDEFRNWYEVLSDDEQESVNFSVDLLERGRTSLGKATRGYGERLQISEYEGTESPA
jgi:hypothetical protein